MFKATYEAYKKNEAYIETMNEKEKSISKIVNY